ncbi:uncharacterized protein ARMOST_01524 [Armillaria ostoyae]|uniref:Uncharacterized protein n=1 Tax=Armillaria ostoyae TaxID=47428 RepID=A0A284QP75_ARMOS|nr:uncharacterized protein ARMOST_01524 [Armillaria ostoyae]
MPLSHVRPPPPFACYYWPLANNQILETRGVECKSRNFVVDGSGSRCWPRSLNETRGIFGTKEHRERGSKETSHDAVYEETVSGATLWQTHVCESAQRRIFK